MNNAIDKSLKHWKLILIILCLLLLIIKIDIDCSKLTINKAHVNAIVINKYRDYCQPSHTDYYYVTLQYKNIQTDINDRELYNTVKKGTTVKTILCQMKNAKSKIIDQWLERDFC